MWLAFLKQLLSHTVSIFRHYTALVTLAFVMRQKPLTKRALLIGINKYLHLSAERQLRGCLQDMKLLSDLLQSRFEFDPSNVSTLRDECATRDGILKAFTDFIATVQTNDIIVVQYCGHGSYMADSTKGSGWTETIVPYDSARGSSVYPSTDIKDEEINEFLVQPLISKTPNLTLLFDCCHSGSIIRDDFASITRGIDPDGKIRRTRGGGRAARSGWLAAENYTLLAACRADEGAHETFRDGVSYGAFTYQLCSLIKESRNEELRTLFQVASATLTAQYPSQHPIIEGCQNGNIFGTDRLETFCCLTVLKIIAMDVDEVQIDGGLASGVTLHSVWAARPLGKSPSESDVRVQIHRVLPFESYAHIVSGGIIQPGFQCFEISHVYGEATLSVLVHNTEDSQAKRIHALFQTPNVSGVLKKFSDTDESGSADVKLAFLKPRSTVAEGDMAPQLGPLNDGAWIALAPDGQTLLPPTTELDEVFENLRKLARYRFGLSLRNPDEDNNLRGKLSLQLRKRANKRDTWSNAIIGEDGFPLFRCGEHIACVITNNSDDLVYPYILEFAEDGSVSQRYPVRGGEEGLASGKSTKEVAPMELDVSSDSFFQLAGDRFPVTGQKRVTEVLKLFASTERIDLSLLLQTSFVRRNLRDRALVKILRKGKVISETANPSWETVDAPFVLAI